MSTGQGGPKRMETFVFCVMENLSSDLHNVMKTSALFHGSFVDISLNMVSGVLLQSGIINTSTYFSPVQFCEKLR